MIVGEKKEKAAAIIIGFDDTSTKNLQNPFAKKPALRSKNLSVSGKGQANKGAEAQDKSQGLALTNQNNNDLFGAKRKELTAEERE